MQFGRMAAGLGSRATARRARVLYASLQRMRGPQRRHFTLTLTDHHSRLSWNDALIYVFLAFGGAVALSFNLMSNLTARYEQADVEDSFYELWKIMRDPAKRFEFEAAARLQIAAPEAAERLSGEELGEDGVYYLLPKVDVSDDLSALRTRRNRESLASVQSAYSASNEKTILAAAGVDSSLLNKALSNPSGLSAGEKSRVEGGLTAVMVARKLAGAGNKHAFRGPAFSAYRAQANELKGEFGSDLKGLRGLARTLGVNVHDTDKAWAQIQSNEQLAGAVKSVVPTLKAKYEFLTPGKEEVEAYRRHWTDVKKQLSKGVVAVEKREGKQTPILIEGTDDSALRAFATKHVLPFANDPFNAVGLSILAPDVDPVVAQQSIRANELFSQLAGKRLGHAYNTTELPKSKFA